MPNIFRLPGKASGPDVVPVGGPPVPIGGATIWRSGEANILFAPARAGVLVNGRPVRAGIRVLGHRDQIHAGSEAWWFSAEDRPVVTPFPGAAGDVCPRCRQRVEAEAPAVRCACGNWFHQGAGLPCFAYAAACPVCQRPTTLDGAPALPAEE